MDGWWEAFAIYLWLWNLMGRQVITMHGHTLTTRRDIGGYGFEKEYDLTQVRDLRASAMGDYSASLQFFGLGGGLIAFDYGSQDLSAWGRIGRSRCQTCGREDHRPLFNCEAWPHPQLILPSFLRLNSKLRSIPEIWLG